MRSPRLIVVAALVVACATPPTSPTEAGGILTGTWSTAAVPSGLVTVLVLRQDDSLVSGSGVDYSGAPSHPLKDLATAGGRYTDGTFDLRLRFQATGTVRFVGSLVGTDAIHGTWTPPAPREPVQIDFFRQPD
jgi:hypothetical protein